MNNQVPKISLGTKIRTVAVFVAIANQGLVAFHHSPIPFNSDKVEEFVSVAFTGVASVCAWWKDNDFTKHARMFKKPKKVKK